MEPLGSIDSEKKTLKMQLTFSAKKQLWVKHLKRISIFWQKIKITIQVSSGYSTHIHRNKKL